MLHANTAASRWLARRAAKPAITAVDLLRPVEVAYQSLSNEDRAAMCDYCDSRQSAWERYFNKRPAQTTDEDGIRAQEAFSMACGILGCVDLGDWITPQLSEAEDGFASGGWR